MTATASVKQGKEALDKLTNFMCGSQRRIVSDCMRGEEKQFFIDKMIELAAQIETMPKSYETDGKGDEAIVTLHYFGRCGDWYIIEKDSDEDNEGQIQAFGYVSLSSMPDCAELGYICLPELFAGNVKLDFHFKPITLGELKRKLA